MSARLKIWVCVLALGFLVAGCGGSKGSASAPVGESAATQLANSVSIGNYKSLSLAQEESKSSSTVKTAYLHKMFDYATSFLMSSAHAQTADCSAATDVLKLVGITDGGAIDPISVTATGTDQCGVGFTDMFNSVNYILLVGEGLYKDGQTCNLVFLQKSNGNMFCVGEAQAARYKIKGSKNWSNYAILQESNDGRYMFLEATAQIFKNNVISGEITKILRFDLSDLSAGPKVTTVYEGYNTSWMGSYSASSEYEGFYVYGYTGLDSGNMAIQYYRYVSNGSSYVSVQRAQYVSFDANGVPSKKTIDFNAVNNWGWINVNCWLRKTTEPTKAFFVTNGGIYSVDNSSNSTVVPSVVQQNTALCQNSWGVNTIARRGDTYYSVVNNYNFGYNYGMYGSSASSISLISNDLSGSDLITPISNVANDSAWGWSQNKIVTSLDYLYITLPNTDNWYNYGASANKGDAVIQVDPASYVAQLVVDKTSGYLIMSVDANMTDNKVKLTGRLKNTDDLDKFAGTISGGVSPSFTVDTSSTSTYKPVSIIKL